jgi:hypothetical protein
MPTPPQRRLALWIVTAGSAFLGAIAWLILIRGERITSHDSMLIGGWVALVAILMLVWLLLKTTPVDAIRLSRRISVLIILGGTIALHALAITVIHPALSEDVVRYRFDGKTWLAGKSPYVMSPAQMENLSSRDRRFEFDRIDRMVPFPVLHTIYPPTSEALFAVEAWLERALHWSAPAEPEWTGEPHPQWREQLSHLRFVERALAFRITSAALSVACAIALLILLRDANRSPWWTILFAWNPLTILETAGMAHQDIAGVLLLLLMLIARNRRRFALAAVLLALAIGVKPIVILLLPFLLRDSALPLRPGEGGGEGASKFRYAPDKRSPLTLTLSRRERGPIIAILAFLVTIALLALPVLYHHGLSGMLLTARIYSQNWEANGSVYELLKIFFGGGDLGRSMVRAKEMSRLLSVTMVLLTGLALWQNRATLAEVGYWFFLILLICAPVAYPWYLLWVICFVPLLRGAQGVTGLVWSGSIALCYLLWRTNDWIMPPAALLWEYVPVGLMLIVELGLLCRGARADAGV